MTDQDKQDLQELQAELVAVETAPWQPRCVSEEFRIAVDPFVFTMQTWIDLEAAHSPFLLGELPEAKDAVEEFETAFRAFGHEETTPEECDPEGLVLLGRRMLAVIASGFSMRLNLEPPDGFSKVTQDNGMGDWLPVLACLKSQLGFSLAEALRLRVGQAFALMSAHRCNEGWSVSGESYLLRDVEGEDHG